MATFGDRLKLIMEAQGIGVRELSRRSGVDASTISKITSTDQSPKERTILDLADALEIPAWQLIGGRGAELSPEALAVALAFERLPPDARDRALGIVRAVVAAFAQENGPTDSDEPDTND